MTTAAFSAQAPHIRAVLAQIKRTYCAPPTFAPAEKVTGHLECPRCKSRLNFTVLTSGVTSGRCTSGSCISWSMQ